VVSSILIHDPDLVSFLVSVAFLNIFRLLGGLEEVANNRKEVNL